MFGELQACPTISVLVQYGETRKTLVVDKASITSVKKEVVIEVVALLLFTI